jgi:hypothetical protein
MTCHQLLEGKKVVGHICTPNISRVTVEAIPPAWVRPDGSVTTECCVRRRPAIECVLRIMHEAEPSYYEPITEIRCAEGKGCNEDARLKAGADGRRWMVFG